MAEMTHETCSELLPGYVRGELARPDEDSVRAHLETCVDCRAEERALAALFDAHEPMDDVERARLHRALNQELFTARANADVAGAGAVEAPWKRWIVPALGSAAAILIVVLVFASGGILSGGDDEAGQTARLEVATRDGRAGGGGGADADAGGSAPERTSKSRALSAEAASEGGEGSAESLYDDDRPTPEFSDLGDADAAMLSELGRSGEPFGAFSDAYRAEEVDDLDGAFLSLLAQAAGPAGRDVRACAETLPGDATLLPAFGAVTEYDGVDALVLGFVTNDSGSARLDRYLIWVWERGSCAQPIDTLFEEIE